MKHYSGAPAEEAETGSREPSPSVSALTGFDPARKWTPGPWLIHAKHRWVVPAGDAFAEPADALPICQLRDPDERLTEDDTLANGFLIAAAPELYEALDALIGSLGPNGYFTSAGEPKTRRAREALAKAKGGE